MAPSSAPATPDVIATTTARGDAPIQHDANARARARRRRLVVLAIQIGLLAVFLGGWELSADLNIIDQFFFGRPIRIVEQLREWVVNGTDLGPLWEQVVVTLSEAGIGFAVGTIAGIICGIALGRVRILAEIFSPYIKVLNSIPRIVLGTIFIVWFGLDSTSKIALAIVLVFFGVFFNAFQGTREVDRNLVANARILGASKRQVTWQVVLPSAMTWIIASLHISFGFALIGAIVGEFLGAQKGLGMLIQQAQQSFNPDGVFAAMIIISVVALVAEGLISLLEKRLLSWRPPQLSGADL
jgi:NitT/TauT family transport system permease protein